MMNIVRESPDGAPSFKKTVECLDIALIKTRFTETGWMMTYVYVAPHHTSMAPGESRGRQSTPAQNNEP